MATPTELFGYKISRILTQRLDLLVQQAVAAIKRAEKMIRLAEAVCTSARTIRAERVPIKHQAARTRLQYHKRTSQLIQELDDASRDLELLKAHIDTAQQNALTPRLKRRQ